MSNRSFAVIALAIYLILVGALALTNLTFVAAPIILGVLAIAAGILLLLGR